MNQVSSLKSLDCYSGYSKDIMFNHFPRAKDCLNNLTELNCSSDIDPEFFCQIRSEEHTSELQSQSNLVCRLLLEKKNQTTSCPLSPTISTRPDSLWSSPSDLSPNAPSGACRAPLSPARPSALAVHRPVTAQPRRR